jgi:cyclophilin family peptidyl-prolyl cis-trans isomerase
MKNFNKGISMPLVVIIIAVVILIIFGGIYYFAEQENSEAVNDEQTEVSEQALNNNVNNMSIAESSQATTSEEIINSDNSIVKNMQHLITIKTNLGNISFATYDADAPETVKNFIKLTEKGFYDGVIFHRVIPGFMTQGGDPTGTGSGGPGYSFADELNPQTESYQAGYKKGVVAMANAGPNTNGSQFFIMVADYPLPNNYTIFGKVVSGQEVADAISKVKTDSNDKPLSKVIMEKVTVEEYNK